MQSPPQRTNILGLLPDEVVPLLPASHPQPYRAAQVLTWLHARGCRSFQEMTDLPRALRSELEGVWQTGALECERTTTSEAGDAIKYLWRLPDGMKIESVYLQLTTRETFCISSQVGCAYGCTFCATATMGLRRNLEPQEIFEQVWHMREELRRRSGQRLPPYNVVFMGMGEPLANYERVVDAIRRLTHPSGLDLSERRITVSTCGLATRIRSLAGEGLKVGLAISLNATTDEVRLKTMPVTRKHSIAEVLDAAAEYARRTGRRVTLEYVLLQGETDTPEDIERLCTIARNLPCKINVIPFNPFDGADHQRPREEWIERFMGRLMARASAPVTMRTTRGRDIAAACGQLAVQS